MAEYIIAQETNVVSVLNRDNAEILYNLSKTSVANPSRGSFEKVIFSDQNGESQHVLTLTGNTIYTVDLGGTEVLFDGKLDELVSKINDEYFESLSILDNQIQLQTICDGSEGLKVEVANCPIKIKAAHKRTSGKNEYKAPFKRLSVTAFSDDVEIDEQAIPNGFTVNVDTGDGEIIASSHVVTGKDYFVTLETT